MSAARTTAAHTERSARPTPTTKPTVTIIPSPKPKPTRPTKATSATAVMQRQRDEALARGDLLGMLHAEATAQPLLSRAQERALARRWRHAGDEAARDELVARNIRLVEWMAERYAATSLLSSADLAAAGMLGLLRAARDFDPERGFAFSTYATWWVEQAIRAHNDQTENTIRLPVRQRQRQRAMRRISERFWLEEAREPTDEELLPLVNARLGKDRRMSATTLRELRAGGAWTVSLEQHEVAFRADRIGRTDPALNAALAALDEARLVDLLQRLLRYGRISPREVCTLARRYGMGEKLVKIGAYLGVSAERARQLHDAGVRKLRAYLRELGVESVQAWMGDGGEE